MTGKVEKAKANIVEGRTHPTASNTTGSRHTAIALEWRTGAGHSLLDHSLLSAQVLSRHALGHLALTHIPHLQFTTGSNVTLLSCIVTLAKPLHVWSHCQNLKRTLEAKHRHESKLARI